MKKSLFFIFYLLLFIGNRVDAANPASFPLNATYNIDSSWQSGYQVTVTVKNTSSTPTSFWSARFNLPNGQKISSFWNGTYTVSGQQVTVKNPNWIGGGVISAGGSTTFGMVINNPQSTAIGILNLQAVANSSSPVPPPVPVAPVLNPITFNANSQNSYNVSWNSVPYATSYTLQQDVTSSFSNPQVVVQGSFLSYSFSNQPNGTYYYRVSATNSSGTSPYSNTQSIVVNVIPVQLNPPVLQPINNSSGSSQYSVTWGAVANAQGYTLQESTVSDFSNYQVVFVGASTSYQISGKVPGNYFYRVIAYAGNSASAPSNIEGVIVTQQPQTTTIVEGYWESWNSAVSINTIANMKADVINISFAQFVRTGTNTFSVSGVEASSDTIVQLVTLAHSLGKKVKISFGGATYPLGPQLQSAQDAVGIAQAAAQYVQQFSLDGVDYDIEDYPAANLQVALIQNTRQLLPNSIISYTSQTPAATTQPYYQVIQAAYPYFDYVSIMAYDNYVGYSYQQDINALQTLGVPPSKIVLGLMPGRDDTGKLTSLSDVSSAATYVQQNGLKGIMFWDLNRDHQNLTGLGVDAATNTAWNIIH